MHADNVGYIFLLYNTAVSQHTKHIDVWHQSMWDYVEDRTLKKNHSEKKLADPFTNNLSNGPFQLLTSRYRHHE